MAHFDLWSVGWNRECETDDFDLNYLCLAWFSYRPIYVCNVVIVSLEMCLRSSFLTTLCLDRHV